MPRGLRPLGVEGAGEIPEKDRIDGSVRTRGESIRAGPVRDLGEPTGHEGVCLFSG